MKYCYFKEIFTRNTRYKYRRNVSNFISVNNIQRKKFGFLVKNQNGSTPLDDQRLGFLGG